MSWRAPLASCAGPLLAVAERFLVEHRGAPPDGPPGHAGVERLAAAIDAWAEREDATSDEDERFVEGAGALLGLLLLAHLGGAHTTDGEQHRLRVGAHGSFDPFAAIEGALDDGRPALAAALRRAEREAAGEEGVGRAARVLAARLGGAPITPGFGAQVTLDDGVELDLAQVVRATEGEREAAVVAAIDKLVAMLPGRGGGGTPVAEARARMLPRLVAPGFAAGVGAAAGTASGGLAARALFGGLLELTLVLGYDGRSRYVREDELAAWSMSRDEAMALAIKNLAARSATARFAEIETSEGAMIVARTGDGLDGARLLLPTLHDVLAPSLGSPFLCASPHRDALYACASGSETLREALRSRTAGEAARAPHPASAALFLVDARGPRPA